MINWRVALSYPGGSAIRYVKASSKADARRLAVELFTAELGVHSTVSMIWKASRR